MRNQLMGNFCSSRMIKVMKCHFNKINIILRMNNIKSIKFVLLINQILGCFILGQIQMQFCSFSSVNFSKYNTRINLANDNFQVQGLNYLKFYFDNEGLMAFFYHFRMIFQWSYASWTSCTVLQLRVQLKKCCIFQDRGLNFIHT